MILKLQLDKFVQCNRITFARSMSKLWIIVTDNSKNNQIDIK